MTVLFIDFERKIQHYFGAVAKIALKDRIMKCISTELKYFEKMSVDL